MIKWLAKRRFNYIDSVGNVIVFLFVFKEQYTYAILAWFIALVISVFIEMGAE